MRKALIIAGLAALACTGGAEARKKERSKIVPIAPPVVYVVPPLTPGNTWDIDLSTGGRVVIQLRPDKAPLMVERIRTLTGQGFYNGLSFHRVIDGFMAQGGDPRGTGEGGSTLPNVHQEFNDLPHVRGAVAAARAEDEDSANSQFYIMLMPNLKLDNHYTVFGRVVSGMQYVDALHQGEPPADPSRIVHASLGTDNYPPPPQGTPAPTPAPLAGLSAAPPPPPAGATPGR